ncbi:MAG: hypothetical protein HFI90_02430 [Clostridia bacterium]|nr:hypothetical protein [Clostridia bacterium]
MFYTVLLVLTCCELIRRVRTFVKENAVVKDGKLDEISAGAFVSLGMSVLLRGSQKSVFDFWERGATTERAILLCF